ncbi:MAG: hypothetical protein ACE5K9_11590 [Candidatus Methylomirabilales bacterium]
MRTQKEKGYWEETMTVRDVRFCPYCSMMEFDMELVGTSVHCDFCGVEILAEELVKSVE